MALKSRVGEIILYDFPYTNYKGSKVRPALIIAENEEGLHEDYIVAYITTEIDNYVFSEFAVVFDINDLESGFVKEKSLIRVDKTVPLYEGQIIKNNVAVLNDRKLEEVLKAWAQLVVETYYKSIHKPSQSSPFVPGKSRVNYAGRVFDEKEMINLVDSSLDFWLTTGKYAERFEKEFAEFLGVKYCSLVNSGSSANLLAFMALTSPELGDRRIKRGDEVITVGAGFPTTVAPIIQYGAVPVFVDVTLPSYNIDCSQLENALSDKTKAVMLAHTLGNPFDIQTVKTFCDKHDLWLIEDNCDALGSKYRRCEREKTEGVNLRRCEGEQKTACDNFAPSHLRTFAPSEFYCYTGTFGHIGTSSFYPPHHMTMGEGGAVYTNDIQLKKIIDSFRDWGRDCWCQSGKDDTCKKRFKWQLGELPYGYDHKYIYSHFGYNLKATDMQAAIGCAQIEKLPSFIEARKKNWKLLGDGLHDLSDKFILPEPAPNSEPCWFGFLLTVRERAGFTRDQIVNHLESNGIQTRMLFAGNLLKHPCFDEMRKTGHGFRVVGSPAVSSDSPIPRFPDSALPVTDRIMRDSFWVGVYPGMKEESIEYVIQKIKEYAKQE
ncbi:MAG: lipopolysaccharide biosynthesis protein RfbH [Dissulfurispiraceae bacterium]